MNNDFFALQNEFMTHMLLHDIAQFENTNWVPHMNRGIHDGGWSALSLRSISGDKMDILSHADTEYKDTELMDKCPNLKKIVQLFNTEIESVRLMKVAPKTHIKTHRDIGICYEKGHARLHVPITTNDKTSFVLDGEKLDMRIGKCYYVNVDKPHSISNDGESPRVHLVIDVRVNDWIKSVFGLYREEIEPVYGHSGITDENVEHMIQMLESHNNQTSTEMAKKLSSIKSRRLVLEKPNTKVIEHKYPHKSINDDNVNDMIDMLLAHNNETSTEMANNLIKIRDK